jgi:hypothetical protein
MHESQLHLNSKEKLLLPFTFWAGSKEKICGWFKVKKEKGTLLGRLWVSQAIKGKKLSAFV